VASSLYTLMPTGDENGDGVNDVLLGQPIKRLSASVQGQVAILSGVDLSVIKTLDSEEVGAFGWGVTSLGDINADGRIDYAVGVPVTTDKGVKSYKGRVYVLRSNDEGGYARSVIDDTEADGYFGYSLASLGGNKDVLAISRPKPPRPGPRRASRWKYRTDRSPVEGGGRVKRGQEGPLEGDAQAAPGQSRGRAAPLTAMDAALLPKSGPTGSKALPLMHWWQSCGLSATGEALVELPSHRRLRSRSLAGASPSKVTRRRVGVPGSQGVPQRSRSLTRAGLCVRVEVTVHGGPI